MWLAGKKQLNFAPTTDKLKMLKLDFQEKVIKVGTSHQQWCTKYGILKMRMRCPWLQGSWQKTMPKNRPF